MERVKNYVHGERNPNCKHSDHDVELVRQLADEGMPAVTIAAKMEIPYATVLKWTQYRSRTGVRVSERNVRQGRPRRRRRRDRLADVG